VFFLDFYFYGTYRELLKKRMSGTSQSMPCKETTY